MPTALVLGIAMLAQSGSDPRPERLPLALHRSMEIDNLDLEILRLHDQVVFKRAELASTQRLAQRGAASRSDVEREAASLRYEEAREAETRAYRDIKVYERDVNRKPLTADEQKEFALVLNWVKAQEAIAQVDVDYRSYLLKQTQALYQRKAVSRQELEDAELDYAVAVASVALSQSRQAQVMMEAAAPRDETTEKNSAAYERLKESYLKARIRYFELTSEAAHRRFAIAQERSRRGLISAAELSTYQKMVDDADATLDAERKKPDQPADADPDTPPPPPTPIRKP